VVPHLFCPSPPQTCPEGQSPQLTTPPHRSGALPQAMESCAQVLGVQEPPAKPAVPAAPLAPAVPPAPPVPGDAPDPPDALLADSSDEPQAANRPAITQGTLHASTLRIMAPLSTFGGDTRQTRGHPDGAVYHGSPRRSASAQEFRQLFDEDLQRLDQTGATAGVDRVGHADEAVEAIGARGARLQAGKVGGQCDAHAIRGAAAVGIGRARHGADTGLALLVVLEPDAPQSGAPFGPPGGALGRERRSVDGATAGRAIDADRRRPGAVGRDLAGLALLGATGRCSGASAVVTVAAASRNGEERQ